MSWTVIAGFVGVMMLLGAISAVVYNRKPQNGRRSAREGEQMEQTGSGASTSQIAGQTVVVHDAYESASGAGASQLAGQTSVVAHDGLLAELSGDNTAAVHCLSTGAGVTKISHTQTGNQAPDVLKAAARRESNANKRNKLSHLSSRPKGPSLESADVESTALEIRASAAAVEV
jgi:hypothetical protein